MNQRTAGDPRTTASTVPREPANRETALLSLLCERDMHPYQIEKAVTHRSMRDWTELSMSSICKFLRRLE